MSKVSSVFISYRRSDTQDKAGRIFDTLSERFGRQSIFKDVDSIPISSDFKSYIVEQIKQSIVLVLIGHRWDTARLHEEKDFVRLEIETAIENSSPLVPILCGGALLPAKSEIPESINSLLDRHGFEVRSDPFFHSDVSKLSEQISTILKPQIESKPFPADHLDTLLKSCQDWYNELVKTLSEIVSLLKAETDDKHQSRELIDGISRIYQNSRSHLPKVLSIRRALSDYNGVEQIVGALEGFLSYIYVQTNDYEPHGYCVEPLNTLLSGRGHLMKFKSLVKSYPDEDGSIQRPNYDEIEEQLAGDYYDISLRRIAYALQELSDSIMMYNLESK